MEVTCEVCGGKMATGESEVVVSLDDGSALKVLVFASCCNDCDNCYIDTELAQG
jgi:uncharacterized protein YuzB (UPF0349 family)